MLSNDISCFCMFFCSFMIFEHLLIFCRGSLILKQRLSMGQLNFSKVQVWNLRAGTPKLRAVSAARNPTSTAGEPTSTARRPISPTSTARIPTSTARNSTYSAQGTVLEPWKSPSRRTPHTPELQPSQKTCPHQTQRKISFSWFSYTFVGKSSEIKGNQRKIIGDHRENLGNHKKWKCFLSFFDNY